MAHGMTEGVKWTSEIQFAFIRADRGVEAGQRAALGALRGTPLDKMENTMAALGSHICSYIKA